MTSFLVDTELLTELIERMSICRTRLEEVEQEVDARMKRLDASWLGTASAMHAEAHQRWVSGSRQTHEALASLREVARTADANYNAAMRANAQMWSR